MSSISPETVVQRQLDAYNARDIDAFLAEYAEDIAVYRPPAHEPTLEGKAAFRAFYVTQRFNHALLHAELVNRIVVGNRVIDHERVSGVRADAFEVAVVYEIIAGRILRTWSFPAD